MHDSRLPPPDSLLRLIGEIDPECFSPRADILGTRASRMVTNLLKEITGILLEKEGGGTLEATWCRGSWELSLRAWAPPRLLLG